MTSQVGFGLAGVVGYTTSNATATTTSKATIQSAWNFVGMTFNSTDNLIHLYAGSPSSSIVELGYLLSTAGLGTLQNDSALTKIIGNRTSSDRSFDGFIAELTAFNRVLTINEMRDIQYGGRIYNGLVGYWPLYGVASPEPDLSGNANNGSVSQTSSARHAPIIPEWASAYTVNV